MSQLETIRDQPAAVETLVRANQLGRLASAYLFVGPSGVGKELAATAWATDVVSGGDPRIIDRIESGSHPDVRVFRPRDEGKRNIQVDVLRNEILPLAQFAPFEAPNTFFIFPEADVSFPEYQPEAANALLKTLEEPRPGVHFILTSERPESLLPTIRSRCQRVRFGRLADAVLRDILTEHGVSEDSISPAIALSAGQADVAIALGQDDAVAELTDLAFSVDAAVARSGPGTLVDLAEALTRRDDLDLALLAMQNLYRDLAVTALDATTDRVAYRSRLEDIRARASIVGPSAAAARVSLIHQCIDSMRQNANRQVALDALLFGLRSTR
ncbi:MAG: AAA family ATPase [Myxococcota bacterium]